MRPDRKNFDSWTAYYEALKWWYEGERDEAERIQQQTRPAPRISGWPEKDANGKPFGSQY